MSAKRKLQKFAQNKTFPHFFEPKFDFQNPQDYEMKANWTEKFFKNKNQIPKYYGGITNQFNYKAFDFSFLVTYSGGFYIFFKY